MIDNTLFLLALRRIKRNRLAMFGGITLLLLTLGAVLAPVLTLYERDEINLTEKNLPPSTSHWLGTDTSGRDIFTRLLYGGRVSLSVGLVSAAIAVSIGLFLGAVSGYFGGIIDGIIMRLVDIFMSFPFFVLAIAIAAVLGPGIFNVMLITGILSWTTLARIVRAEVLSLKEREFIEAARALGLSPFEIITAHIIPNVMAPVVIYATLSIAGGILSEAGLSFLGLGVKMPTPSWGNMLASAQDFISFINRWWQWLPPGLMVFITVLSINFLGDGLRDAFDPKLKRGE